MAETYFDSFLSDGEMRVQLDRGETFFFKIPKWQQIEDQIERLGYENLYFVTQVSARRGELTKVSPVIASGTQIARRAA